MSKFVALDNAESKHTAHRDLRSVCCSQHLLAARRFGCRIGPRTSSEHRRLRTRGAYLVNLVSRCRASGLAVERSWELLLKCLPRRLSGVAFRTGAVPPVVVRGSMTRKVTALKVGMPLLPSNTSTGERRRHQVVIGIDPAKRSHFAGPSIGGSRFSGCCGCRTHSAGYRELRAFAGSGRTAGGLIGADRHIIRQFATVLDVLVSADDWPSAGAYAMYTGSGHLLWTHAEQRAVRRPESNVPTAHPVVRPLVALNRRCDALFDCQRITRKPIRCLFDGQAYPRGATWSLLQNSRGPQDSHRD